MPPGNRIPDRLPDIAAIERLNSDFGHYLDRGDIGGFCALFTPDAVYANGARVSEGRAEIAAFLQGRTTAGPRTSRHIYSGLRIDFTDEAAATGTSVWMSFAANAHPPIQMAEPFLVADMDDQYIMRDGRWFFVARRITPVFVNPRVPPPGAEGADKP